MSEYQRFITYFYEYRQEKRQRNAGFAKIECRNGSWRVKIQIKGKAWMEEPVKIYGYYKEEEKDRLVLLTETSPQKGLLDKMFRWKTDWMADGRISFEWLDGLWIPNGNGQGFGAVFPKADVLKRKELQAQAAVGQRMVRLPREPQEELEAMKQVLQNQGIQEKDHCMKEEKKVRVEKARPREGREFKIEEKKTEMGDEKQKTEKSGEKEWRSKEVRDLGRTKPREEKKEETEAETQKEVRSEAGEKRRKEGTVGGGKEIRERTAEQQKREYGWRKLWNSHLRIGRVCDYECIVICPGELPWMHQQGWAVGRNSFVMQGFAKYHHLIFGRKEKEGDKEKAAERFLLGVPESSSAETKLLAERFGFYSFYPAGADRTERSENDLPGYWCREL